MLIKNLKLKNFRQYRNVEIEFSTDEEKNITIIIGENGYGKTTLVRSFIWCLYGENGFNNKILLNHEVAKEMQLLEEKEVKVEMNLDHNNASYRITTRQMYRKGADGKIIELTSKPTISIVKMTGSSSLPLPSDAVRNEVEKILKDELKDYFFYDGENNKIESVSKKKNIKNAVTEMMGIKKIETLQMYFDPESKRGIVNALTKEIEGDELELEPLKEEYEELLSKKDELEKKIEEGSKEVERLNIQLREQNEIIEANLESEELIKEKKKLEKENDLIIGNMDANFDALLESLNGNKNNNTLLKFLFASCYSKYNLSNLVNESSFTTKESLSHISEEAIDQLIKRGFCLCGTKIESNEDALCHLKEAKEHMEPHDFGKYLDDFCSSEESNISFARLLANNTSQSGDAIINDIEKLEHNRERIRDLNTKLEGKKDIGEIQKFASEIEAQIFSIEGINLYIENEQMPSLNQNIEIKNNEIQKLALKSDHNALVQDCIRYAKAVSTSCNKKIRQAKKEIKESLQEEVNSIFCSMYHGDRKIEIDDDFKVITLTDNNKLDNSTGIETVKNFAFVAGLLKIVKKHLLQNDKEFADENEVDESYPLVMDAPFSNTDEKHIKNICTNLPLYCNQLFIVVIEKDYNVAKEDLLGRVGKKYQIRKHTETYDTIEEVLD